MPYGRGHIPYRGEVRPKLRGHPSPQKPNERAFDGFVGFVFLIAGVVVLVFCINNPGRNGLGFIIFGLYLLFLIISILAYRDLKKIKMLTPDEGADQPNHDHKVDDDLDEAVLLEDYLTQVEWNHTHRKRHHPSYWSVPEPQWRYHAIKTAASKVIGDLVKSKVIFILTSFVGIAIIASLTLIFRASLSETIGLVGITSLGFLAIYIVRA